MYLKRVRISNIRSLSKVDWTAPSENLAGWHVILGNNGSGKSTLLRSIATATIGANGLHRLGVNLETWLQNGQSRGEVLIDLHRDLLLDPWDGAEGPPMEDLEVSFDVVSGRKANYFHYPIDIEQPLCEGEKGWFIASFGPFRRFGQTGNNGNADQIFSMNHQLARHITLFSEDIILKDVLSWLKELQFRQLAGDKRSALLLDHIRMFINQVDFLPYDTRLEEITPDEVIFRDGNKALVNIQSLSDGYRSMLSLVFELIRQLVLSYPIDTVFDPDKPGIVQAPGVVLIDEIDVHLHPNWQTRIGPWLCSRFPKIQFIVTTHSPLACHAATRGSVFKLPEQGSQEQGRFLDETELNRLLYGNVLEAYGSGAFGSVTTRSERGQQLLQQLAELNLRDFRDELSDDEKAHQRTLMAMFPMGTGS